MTEVTAVRLLSPWKVWPKGHVIPAMAPNLASLLISRGVAEEVKSNMKPFTAPVDRAVRSSQMTMKRR